jgi:hypothetical protein
MVLGGLCNLNYHIKLESGAAKGKAVHRNRLKLDKKQFLRGNCIERSEEKEPDTTTFETGILHQEIPAGTLVEPAPYVAQHVIADTLKYIKTMT